MPRPSSDWQRYYEATAGQEGESSKLAGIAVKYVKNKDRAVDLGAGSFRDPKFFIDSGFKNVIAYDINGSDTLKLDVKYSGRIESDNRLFREFDYPENTFDLVFSRSSFQFIPPDKFDLFMNRIRKSVKPEGILAIEMLGPNDPWSHTDNQTFKTLDELKSVLSDMEILWTKDLEYDSPMALEDQKENTKHWHKVFIIARKKII